MNEQEFLAHIGVLRKSGRYPWGSGDNPNQRNRDFLAYVDDLRKKGLSDTEIARGAGLTTTQLRAVKSIAKTQQRQADQAQAVRLKDAGMSNVAIGQEMGLNESSVRALLNPAAQERSNVLATTAGMLKSQVAEKKYIDIGTGVERYLDISPEKLKTAVAMLQEEGYTIHYLKVEQLGTGQQTTVKVLAAPDTSYSEVFQNRGEVRQIQNYSEDGGLTFRQIEPPRSIDSKRLAVRYAEEGGADADGVIYLRRGVDDISLGASRYAQVRIAVDDTHYLKGMAMYKDDLPDGVDLMFNTNKSDTGNKLDALKGLKDDEDLPFGSIVRQRHYQDVTGKTHLSSINIVNEEGKWHNWSRTFSSQMLSKQSAVLAKKQLGISYDLKKAEYDEIMALTNPVVRKKLLDAFSDGADSAAVHLKAAGLPRTRNHVILPITDMKPTEIYAPGYKNGEKVVLVRHPHGGTFEIPELTVNNRHRSAKAALGQAIDAVGIHPSVAERLSGADFDGDTVLVIPNDSRSIKTSPALAGLKDFDPKVYKLPDSAPRMSARTKQREMGDASNLITDMTIKGASHAEIARAVRHSMVVIDAEKHHLDYKQSKIDNGITQLKARYQGGARAGADTLISQAKSTVRVPDRKPRSAKLGGPIDPATGKKVYEETGASYTDAKGRPKARTIESKKLAETDDAFTLSSGTDIEAVYATHSNKLKALANTARKSALQAPSIVMSSSAKKAYASEVASLNVKLNQALKNAPRERQAQIIANAAVSQKRQANPDLELDEIKKIKSVALTQARLRTGAEKERIDLTPSEWNAIQAGAISTNKLNQILDNADLDQIKKLATPREATVMTAPTMARAQSMLSAGYTQAEIADALGIPTSTLNDALIIEKES